MDAPQSIYDTPGSLLEYEHQGEPWQSNDGMELRLVGEDGHEKSVAEAGFHSTLKKSNPLTIGPKFHTMKRTKEEGSVAFNSSQPQVLKYALGFVTLSFVLSLVSAILATVALKNSTGSSTVGKRVLPASQKSFASNSSGT